MATCCRHCSFRKFRSKRQGMKAFQRPQKHFAIAKCRLRYLSSIYFRDQDENSELRPQQSSTSKNIAKPDCDWNGMCGMCGMCRGVLPQRETRCFEMFGSLCNIISTESTPNSSWTTIDHGSPGFESMDCHLSHHMSSILSTPPWQAKDTCLE